MTRDYDDPSENNNDNTRREPGFGGFNKDDVDEYEEPDRDTNYTSGYRADGVTEEYEDSFPEENEDNLKSVQAEVPLYKRSPVSSEPDQTVTEQPDSWLEDEDGHEQEESSGHSWPFGLIAVAIVALLLLAAGGYGVIRERAAAQEELLDLRAALATTASPKDVRDSREALFEMKLSYDKLAAEERVLTLENQKLADTVARLKSQLEVQQAVLTKKVPATKQVKPAAVQKTTPSRPKTPEPVASKPATPVPAASKPASPAPVAAKTAAPAPAASPTATPKPASTQTAAVDSSTPWFVNFGSYSARTMAETWAAKLHPIAGKVIVATSAQDGKTFYRVRVVGLASKDSANEVARKLEAEQQVSQLWVGRD